MPKNITVFDAVTLDQAREIMLLLGPAYAYHFYGPPGIGKTTAIEALAAELSQALVDKKTGECIDEADAKARDVETITEMRPRTMNYVDLTDVDPTEMRGDAFVNPLTGELQRNKPTFFPKPHSVLFFDEFTSAMPTLQAEGNKIAFSRRMGEWFIPKDVFVIFAGNKPEHKAIAYNMPSHVANKLCIFDVRADLDTFIEYGLNKGFHPDVLAYLSVRGNHLCALNEVDDSGRWPSPRQWERISNLCHKEHEIPARLFPQIVVSFIGKQVANEFFVWREVKESLVPPQSIIDGKAVYVDEPGRTDVSFANLYSMVFFLKDRKLTDVQLERAAAFGNCFKSAEVSLVYFKHVSKLVMKLVFTKGFMQYYSNHKEVMDKVLGAPISAADIKNTLSRP